MFRVFRREGISLCLRCDQHLVGSGIESDGAGAEGGVPGAAAVEPEHELAKVGLQVLWSQAVVDIERSGLEVGEHAMDPGQHDMGGDGADDAWVVVAVARVGGPAFGPGGGADGEVCGEEGVQVSGGVVRDLRLDAAGAAVADSDGAGDERLALVAAATTAGRRAVLGAAGDRGLPGPDGALIVRDGTARRR